MRQRRWPRSLPSVQSLRRRRRHRLPHSFHRQLL
ncbi:hypothetical protein OROMI_004636 [Orobanche minor]